MSEHIFKRHNKSLLLYHLVCPIKYRRNVLSEEVEISLVEVCKNISEHYEIHFIEEHFAASFNAFEQSIHKKNLRFLVEKKSFSN